MSSENKISRRESLTFANFKKKLDSVLHQCRKTEYKKMNEKRKNKIVSKSLDKSIERLSCPNMFTNNSLVMRNKISSKHTNIQDQISNLLENQSFFDNPIKEENYQSDNRSFSKINEKKGEIPKKEYWSENNRQVSKEIDDFIENEAKILENLRIDENDQNAIPKLKEIIYKLQLRDAVHRQKIIKLQSTVSHMNDCFEKVHLENAKLVEINKQENKNSKNLSLLLENEKKKVCFLEKKMKKLDPIETAKLLEKLHEKNENLQKENKKFEEMIKQLLLNREINRIRNLYPNIIEKIQNSTPKKNEKKIDSSIIEENSYEETDKNSSSKYSSSEKYFKNISEINENKETATKNNKVKNVCLDLKDILREFKQN